MKFISSILIGSFLIYHGFGELLSLNFDISVNLIPKIKHEQELKTKYSGLGLYLKNIQDYLHISGHTKDNDFKVSMKHEQNLQEAKSERSYGIHLDLFIEQKDFDQNIGIIPFLIERSSLKVWVITSKKKRVEYSFNA